MKVKVIRVAPLLTCVALIASCGVWASPPSAGTHDPTPAITVTATGPALRAALDLPVHSRAASAGYSRDQFGQAWNDDVTVSGGHNGCDQRSDLIRRDLIDIQIKPNTHGCVPLSGTLHDPYTGQTIHFQRGKDTSDDVQIDHVVALSDAWQTGAQNLMLQERKNLAGDPINLWAVDGPTNQAKGDSDASQWLPPDPSIHCSYVARQVAVKTTYRLWVTPAEQQAILDVLRTCPDQALPDADTTAVPALAR